MTSHPGSDYILVGTLERTDVDSSRPVVRATM